jgi:hypothetical protein
MLADNSNSDYDPYADDIRSVRVQAAAVLLPGVFLALVAQFVALVSGGLADLATLPADAMRMSMVSLGVSLVSLIVLVTGSPGWGKRGFGGRTR